MMALLTALRALDPKTFELLVLALLKERYPTREIKHLNGDAGDQGIDLFAGDLEDGTTIWQCKAFANGVGKSQKQQITASLKQALRHYRPHRWVLCVACDLDAKAARWFQRLAADNAPVGVDFLQASDISHLLLHSHTIRELFFPQTVLNVPAIREQAANTATTPTGDVIAIAEKHAQVLLARFQAYDPRLACTITTARDTTPATAPDALASITIGCSTINFLPRDVTALRQNPLEFQARATSEGHSKLDALTRTGRAQVLSGSADLVDVTTPFDALLEPMGIIREEMRLELSSVPNLRVPLRLTFGTTDPVRYEYLEFVCTRAGTDEQVFENHSCPFSITILFGPHKQGTVTFGLQWAGHSVVAVRRFLNAMTAAFRDGNIACYDLQQQANLGKLAITTKLPPWIAQYQQFIDQVAFITEVYEVSLTMPETISEDDFKNIRILHEHATGRPVAPDTLSIELAKIRTEAEQLITATSRPADFRIVEPITPDTLTVFGTPIRTGMITIDIPQATFQDREELHKFLRDAPDGTMRSFKLITNQTIVARRYPERDTLSPAA